MSTILSQPILVENRSGAAGAVGTALVARSKADGYTLGIATVSTHGTVPNLVVNPGYDAVRDFTPVSNLAVSAMCLSINATIPVRSLQAFVAYVRANPNKLAYGNAGSGGVGDLGMTWFLQIVQASMLSVPYKGSAPALNDLAGGQVQATFDNFPSTLGFIRSGKIVPLAITGRTRSHQAPDIPTFSEAGYPNFDVGAWYGLVGPAGMPPDILERLSQAAVRSVFETAVSTRLTEAGAVPVGNRPEEFAAQIGIEVARWRQVIKQAGIVPQ
jgi:tripartite-type tricarboxylate transporter receptor subunit TctC